MVRAAVVYESMFGNTRAIAEAVCEGLRVSDPELQVSMVQASEATPDDMEDVDLLVVGAPTHLGRMPSRRSRKQFKQATGVRELLDALPPARPGRQAAAFDTDFGLPLSGSAAPGISRRLRRHGYKIVAKPTGFIVEKSRGPLRVDELERARTWGAGLIRR